MRRLIFVALVLLGCEAAPGNGQLPCSHDRRCPQNYWCAPDEHCWLNGTAPDGWSNDGPGDPSGDAGADVAPPVDFSLPIDLTPPSDAGRDLADGQPQDLAIGGDLVADDAGPVDASIDAATNDSGAPTDAAPDQSAVPDDLSVIDQSVIDSAADVGGGDAATADLAQNLIVTPPSMFFRSGGGGGSVSAGGGQMEISIGGSVVFGSDDRAEAQVVFGNLCSGTTEP